MSRLAKSLFNVLNSRYVLVLGLAFVWVMFFDRYNLRSQQQMQQQIESLETDKEFYKEALGGELKSDQVFDHPDDLERFARERYFMKKSNEDVFLAE